MYREWNRETCFFLVIYFLGGTKITNLNVGVINKSGHVKSRVRQ